MGTPAEDEVRAAAQRIQERIFPSPSALSRFFDYTVTRSLAGESDMLKEAILGESLFHRRSFDPRLDPIVRVTASRLRGKLNEYYASAGRDETVIIGYPKGSYAPTFRYRSTGEVLDPVEAVEPEGELEPAPEPEPALSSVVPPPPRSGVAVRSKWLIAAATVTLAGIGLLASGWRYPPWARRPDPPRVAFQIPANAGAPYDFQEKGSVALSSDGARLATLVRADEGSTAGDLRVTLLSSGESRLVPSLRGVLYPFWSPDGRRIGGHLNGKLVHAAIDGGPVTALCDTDIYSDSGGTWGPSGDLLFSTAEGIKRTTAGGGGCSFITTVDRQQGETGHRWPYFLPGGEHFIYTVTHQRRDQQGLRVASLRTPRQWKWLVAADSSAAFVSTSPDEGVLLYVANGDLMEIPIDGRSLSVKGEPKVAANGVGMYAFSGSADFSVSANGVLAYRPSPPAARELIWLDRKGRKSPTGSGRALFRYPDVRASDGAVAVESIPAVSVESEIWMVSDGKPVRITVDAGQEIGPIWSPSGDAVAYAKDMNLAVLDLTGGKEPRKLVEGNVRYPTSWSSGGKWIAYTRESPKTGLDVCVAEVANPANHRCIAETGATENRGALSPDGQWIAYSSIDNGEYSILVTRVEPGAQPPRKIQVSSPGSAGAFPRWSKDGREIFFIQSGSLVSVTADTSGAELRLGAATLLFPVPFYSGGFGYSVDGSASRFVFSVPAGGERPRPGPVNIVVNRFLERP